VYEVDPYNLEETDQAFKSAIALEAPSVIVAKRACALKVKNTDFTVSVVDQDQCKKCKACLKIGCPAIVNKGDVIMVDRGMCYGCGICRQVCQFGAIVALESE
jgi:indolepyruvate ferredoxin oxidoreductase, alpha subunit